MTNFIEFLNERTNLALARSEEKLSSDAKDLLNAIRNQSKVAFLVWKIDKVKNINNGVSFIAKSKKNRKGLVVDIIKKSKKANISLKSLSSGSVVELKSIQMDKLFIEIQKVLNQEV